MQSPVDHCPGNEFWYRSYINHIWRKLVFQAYIMIWFLYSPPTTTTSVGKERKADDRRVLNISDIMHMITENLHPHLTEPN